MRPDLQSEFNRRVSDQSHAALVASLERRLGIPIDFRICEMPIIISSGFAEEMQQAAQQIIIESISPQNIIRSQATLQSRYTVPHESDRPLFSVVDFAVTVDAGGRFVPKLIELQGFPSLFGYQWALMSEFTGAYRLDGTPFLSGLDEGAYRLLLTTSIFGECDPSEVALVEIDPDSQKTRPDFLALKELIGLQTINIRDITTQGRSVMYRDDTGRLRPLRRIFNRAIIDELDDMGVELGFSWNDDLDVEWAGHPNWYFRISKFLLPHLRHGAAPTSLLLTQLDELPDTRIDEIIAASVLKPLYAFAGKGVNVNPTRAHVDAVPHDERSGWILQEKVHYAPCVPTPQGDNYVEIRIMLIWPETSNAPIPVITLARTGRGALMGARYNVEPWTGSSGCLIV
ncbi:MAG: hypothetical protein FGM32_10110 [Candidatus Kapabacteria bacterium]|nr:hypothetical protein [Candidatus Kapabacteria bacterium]